MLDGQCDRYGAEPQIAEVTPASIDFEFQTAEWRQGRTRRLNVGRLHANQGEQLSHRQSLKSALNPIGWRAEPQHVACAGAVARLMERFAQLRAQALMRTEREFGFPGSYPMTGR